MECDRDHSGFQSLDRVLLSKVKSLSSKVKSYPEEGFIDEHELWNTMAGLAFFHSRLQLSESMKLEFLMGYDGPFRLWLDGNLSSKIMAGTNPCFPDGKCKTHELGSRIYDLHVGMDLNNARAWGFFLRFARTDVTKEQIVSGKFVKPVYLV